MTASRAGVGDEFGRFLGRTLVGGVVDDDVPAVERERDRDHRARCPCSRR